MNAPVASLARPARLQTVLAFLAIYVIWGSTFLAIRYAVESIPPLFTAATRHLVAGSLLLAWALWNGERPTRQGWRAGIVLGFLFFLVSHGLLHWAEVKVPSGVAALVIAIEPAIVALLLPLLKLGPRPRGVTWAAAQVTPRGLGPSLSKGSKSATIAGSIAITSAATPEGTFTSAQWRSPWLTRKNKKPSTIPARHP